MLNYLDTPIAAFSINQLSKFAPYLGALAGVLILGIIIMQLYKKTKIFKDALSLLIIFTLIAFGIITFGAYRLEPIIGFTYVFYIMLFLSCIGGIVYTVILSKGIIGWAKEDGFWKEFLVALSICIGILIIAIIIMVSNGSESRSESRLLFSFLPFIMPLVFYKAYVFWMNIPGQKFKSWKYPVGRSLPTMELVDTMLIHIDLRRVKDDLDMISTKIRAPRNERFSDLFYFFLYKYNNEKHVDNKINVYENYDEQLYNEWLFYIKQDSGVSKSKVYFNPEQKIIDLELKENQHIIAERV